MIDQKKYTYLCIGLKARKLVEQISLNPCKLENP